MALGLSRCREKTVAFCFLQIVPLSRKAERKESIERTESTRSKEENTRRLNPKAIM